MFSNNEFSLLSRENVGISDKPSTEIQLIKILGKECAITDFAILLGGIDNKFFHVDYDSSSKGRTGAWHVAGNSTKMNIPIVGSGGNISGAGIRRRRGGIRPIIRLNDKLHTSNFNTSILYNFKVIEYGEYPQYATDDYMQVSLENLYLIDALKKTGKVYTTDCKDITKESEPFEPFKHIEYELNGKRYVRVTYTASSNEVTMSTNRKLEYKDFVWIEVSPIEWLYDENENILVSKNILAAGIRYCPYAGYPDYFRDTEIYMFLNTHFKNEIVKNSIKENVEDKNETKSKKKSNPYGLNFKKVSEEEIIIGAIESGVPVFLHGRSSEGKSARVKQIDKDCTIIYLRNATPESLNGKSVYNSETGTMIDIKPTWLQKLEERCKNEPDKNHIVFFDEITNALPSIQGIAFNIVLDKEVNGIWKLPENAQIVAAGNDMNDSLAANKLAEPLFNRFAHVYIETTVDSWLKWASENNIHPAIYSYIAYKKDKVLRSEYNGETPNADPRKWEMASKVLYQTGNIKSLRSLVGKEITDEFVAFCSQSVITLEDVLNNNYTDYDLEMNVGEKYATIIGLTQVDEENYSIVREFVSKLGNEFVSIFDSMWMRNDEERMEIVKETKLENSYEGKGVTL